MSNKIASCLHSEKRHCLSLAVPSVVPYASTLSFSRNVLLRATFTSSPISFHLHCDLSRFYGCTVFSVISAQP